MRRGETRRSELGKVRAPTDKYHSLHWLVCTPARLSVPSSLTRFSRLVPHTLGNRRIFGTLAIDTRLVRNHRDFRDTEVAVCTVQPVRDLRKKVTTRFTPVSGLDLSIVSITSSPPCLPTRRFFYTVYTFDLGDDQCLDPLPVNRAPLAPGPKGWPWRASLGSRWSSCCCCRCSWCCWLWTIRVHMLIHARLSQVSFALIDIIMLLTHWNPFSMS